MDDNQERPAGREFDEAVRTERKAIKVHDAAAERHTAAAEALQRQANEDGDELIRKRASDRAAKARARAQRARQRAEFARERLRDEGVDPDG